jgi:hypothetical protein
MPTEHIVALLIAERDRLTKAIEALQGPAKRLGRPPKNPVAVPAAAEYSDPTMPDWVKSKSKVAPTPEPVPTKRKMSAAGRRAIREGVRRRWAAVRAAKGQAEAKSQPKATRKAKETATKESWWHR